MELLNNLSFVEVALYSLITFFVGMMIDLCFEAFPAKQNGTFKSIILNLESFNPVKQGS